jgi:hypothetical protein
VPARHLGQQVVGRRRRGRRTPADPETHRAPISRRDAGLAP